MIRRFFMFVALAAWSLPAACLAGAWTQPEHGYYARLAVAGIDSRSRFDGSGARTPYPGGGNAGRHAEYRGREFRGYGEYGLLRNLTVYGSIAYKRLAVEEPAVLRETYGFGDLYLGGRYPLVHGAIPLSLAAEVKIPTDYSTSDLPALGSGQLDSVVRLLAGVSGARWYATGDAGFMLRAESFRSQAVGSLEAGGRAGRGIGGRAVLRWAESLGRAARAGVGFDPALASPRMVTLDGTMSVDVLPGLALEASISHALLGREALAGNMLELAVARSGARASDR